jgi:uncharacterized protein (DUF2267 family)
MERSTFLRLVTERLGCDERRADAVTVVVLQELRDRLTEKEAADVASQLPAELRATWQENEHHGRNVRRIHRDEFIGRVRKRAVLPDDAEAERAVRAVFAVLQTALGSAHGTEGEAWDVFAQLPKDLKTLWLDASRRATA